MPPSPHSEFFVRVFYLVVTKTSKLFEPGPLNVTQHKGEPREKERASRDKPSDIERNTALHHLQV